MGITRHNARNLWRLFAATVILAASTAANGAETADDILDSAGIKGGLVVHVGCGDGKLTAALRANDGYLVHGLDVDADNVAAARNNIRNAGLYGKVAVDQLQGNRLPYNDNVVNLLVADDLGRVPQEEVMRVLAPNGVAYVKSGDKWTKTVKPRPKDIDDWTHFLYDPSGNCVSNDMVVDVPYRVQWVGGPRWARSHDQLATVSVVVSSGGRIFYIVDEGPTASVAMPSKWFLIARDAFSGVVLWKRPVRPWETQLRHFRSGPAELHRRLIAVGERLYASLGYHKPLVEIDAATGKTLKTYQRTDGTLEVVLCDGVLYIVTGAIEDVTAERARLAGMYPHARNRKLLAVDAETGKLLWSKDDADTDELMPLTMAIAGGKTYFQNPEQLVCLEAASGNVVWKSDHVLSTAARAGWCTPTLVVADDVVLVGDRARPKEAPTEGQRRRIEWTSSRGGGGKGGELIAFSAESGKRLWSTNAAETYTSPVDVFVVDDTVWVGKNPSRSGGDFAEGHDLHTGVIKKEMDTSAAWTRRHHHRCYRNRATQRHILLGRTGIAFIDLTGGDRHVQNGWVRGTCQFGVLPANGLIYAPPHSCACYIQSKLAGFYALAPKAKADPQAQRGQLQQGPAFGKSAKGAAADGDWVTYRGNATRSGRATCSVPAGVKKAWETDLGEAVSAPVVAGGKVFVARVDSHAVCALDAATGKECWRYDVGGRVDSPPTVADGLAVFGCRDGYVYCLRADDGELVWRFRGAPVDRRMVAYGQVESVWPVHGNVMVKDGSAYFVAGRSGCLDGGLWVYRLDLKTGKKLAQSCIYRRDVETGEQLPSISEGMTVAGGLPDVLHTDGQNIYMRNVRLDANCKELEPNVTHMYSPAGFLDDAWWHRTYWILGTAMQCGYGGWSRVGNVVPSGRLMVMDDENIYGWGRTGYSSAGSHVGLNTQLHLFAASQNPDAVNSTPQPPKQTPAKASKKSEAKGGKKQQRRKLGPTGKVKYLWTRPAELYVRAMVLADKTLFVAGPRVDEKHSQEAFEGAEGIVLRALSATDGEKLAEVELAAMPVFDGLVAAGGKLYLATTGGKVTCWGE